MWTPQAVQLISEAGTLQKAHDALPPRGGLILVDAPVVLDREFRPTKTVEIHGLGRRSTTIKRAAGYNGNLLTITGAASSIHDMTIDSSGDLTNAFSEIVLPDFGSARNVEIVGYRGIAINAAANGVLIDGCLLRGVPDPTILAYGVWADWCQGLRVQGCTIRDSGGPGLLMTGSDMVINGCVFYRLHQQSSPVGGGHVAVGGGGSRGISITGNVFAQDGAGGGASGLELNGDQITVTGNTIRDMPHWALALQQGTGYVVNGNTFVGSGIADILVNPAVTAYTITNNRYAAIADNGGTPKLIANNLVG